MISKRVFLAIDFEEEMKEASKYFMLKKSSEFLDRNVNSIRNKHFGSHKVLFQRNLTGFELDRIIDSTFWTIMKYNVDIYKHLYTNVVLLEVVTMTPSIYGFILK